MTRADRAQVESAFTYHPPTPAQIKKYELIRDTARLFALLLLRTCPASRELSLALTNLEQCVMWANASIARNEKGSNDGR